MNEPSVSDTSSSSTSKASKYTISPDIVALGETPIISTVIKQFFLALPGTLFPMLQQFAEFKYIGMYCGMSNTALYAFIFPFVMILNQATSLSLAQTCANLANRNIIQSQYTSANIYFAYYFVACFLTNCVVAVFGIYVLKRFYATPTSRSYFNLTFGLFPFMESATFSLDRFYMVENRTGIIASKSLVSLLCALVLFPLVMNHCNGGDISVKQGLDQVVYAQFANYVIYLAWSLIVVLRVRLLGVGYVGVLKFSLRRMRPFRIKFVLHLYANCMFALLPNINVPLAFLVVQFILKYHPMVQFDINMLLFRDYLVFLTAQLFAAIYDALASSFYRIASYNVAIKKMARTYDFFIATILFSFAFSVPFILTIALTARQSTAMLIPTILTLTRNEYYEIDNSYLAVLITAVSQLLGCLIRLSAAFLRIESKMTVLLILHLPSLLYVVATPFLFIAIVGRGCDLYYVMAFFEFINAMTAIPLMVLYNERYKSLKFAELERQKKTAKEAEVQARYSEIRESVVYAFNEAVNAEENNQPYIVSPYRTRCGIPSLERLENMGAPSVLQTFMRQRESSGKFVGSVLRRSMSEFETQQPQISCLTNRSSEADTEQRTPQVALKTRLDE